MAERRMFSKQITETDAFLDMPFSAQLLYFHLCMYADDDGFVSSPRKIQRMIGCTGEDMNILAGKHFIIPFNSGVLAIKHWKINNQIQKDRYHPTKYEEEKRVLIEKPNGAYTLSTGAESLVLSLYTSCIQDVSKTETEVSIDKISIDKDSKNILFIDDEPNAGKKRENYSDEFEMLWKIYPRKQGDKKKAYKSYAESRKKKEVTFEIVEKAINDYVLWLKAYGKFDTEYVALGSTWFNQKRWTNDYTVKKKLTLNDIAPAIDSSIIFEE